MNTIISTYFKLICLFMVIFFGAFHFYLNYINIIVGIDQFRQLDGALHLFLGHGYIKSDGTNVQFWPPMYAYIVKIFMHIFGQNYLSIVFANSTILTFACAGWSILFLKLRSKSNAKGSWIDLAVVAIISLWILYQLRSPASQATFYMICPLYLLSSFLAFRENFKAIPYFIIHTTLSILIVNSHNMGAIFFAASNIAFLIIFVLMSRRVLPSIISILSSIIAVMSWLYVRAEFNLEGSHRFEFLGEDQSLADNIIEFVLGVSNLFFFYSPAGLVILALLNILIISYFISSFKHNIDLCTYFLFICILSHFLLTSIVFSSVYINSSLGGRFALIINLIILIAAIGTRKNANIIILVCILFVGASNVTRVSKMAFQYSYLKIYSGKFSIETNKKVTVETLNELYLSRK